MVDVSTKALLNSAFKRVVEDGNTIQTLIGKTDICLSTGSYEDSKEALEMLINVLGQLDSSLALMITALDLLEK